MFLNLSSIYKVWNKKGISTKKEHGNKHKDHYQHYHDNNRNDNIQDYEHNNIIESIQKMISTSCVLDHLSNNSHLKST
jgi:hypothetical protein